MKMKATTNVQATVLPFRQPPQAASDLSPWLRDLIRRSATPAYKARVDRELARYDAWLVRHGVFTQQEIDELNDGADARAAVKLAARLDRRFKRSVTPGRA